MPRDSHALTSHFRVRSLLARRVQPDDVVADEQLGRRGAAQQR
jgi:hypothetical protein